jgi:hypothetical protein
MKTLLSLVAITALLIASSCKRDEPKTTYTITTSGGLDSNGFADIYTISGGPFYNGNAWLSVSAWGDEFGSFDAQYGSQFYSGALVYQGNGIIKAQYPGSIEHWTTTVSGSQVMVSAGTLGVFVIDI